MEKIISGMILLGLFPSFAEEYLNVSNKIKIPRSYLIQDRSLISADLASDGVEKVGGFIVVKNPRLKLKNEYKGFLEIPISSRNITVDNLCGLLGFSYWETTEQSPFEEKQWGSTPVSSRVSVVLEAPTTASFRFHSYKEYDHDGVIKKLACKP